MAELGIAAGIIGIASFAYTSSKGLYDFIDAVRGAPLELRMLKEELGQVNTVLAQYQEELARRSTAGGAAAAEDLSIFAKPRPCIDGLQKACEDFEAELKGTFSHSTDDHSSVRDRVRYNFKEKKIAALKYRIATCKDTVNIALSFASL